IGCVFVREAERLRDTFRILPDYLQDVDRTKAEIHPCDHGIQLTRGFRALKLWLSFKVFGVAAFRDAIRRGLRLAEQAEAALRSSGRWEIVTPAQLGILTFRLPGADAINERLVPAMIADGFAMFSSTRLRGRTALRGSP